MTHARLLLEGRGPNDRNRVAFGPKSVRFADTLPSAKMARMPLHKGGNRIIWVSSRNRRLRRTVTCARGFSRPLRDRVRVGARTESIGEGRGAALHTWPATSRRIQAERADTCAAA
jgi:hypothetical protein